MSTEEAPPTLTAIRIGYEPMPWHYTPNTWATWAATYDKQQRTRKVKGKRKGRK